MVKLTETLVLARSRASDLETVRKLNCWGSDLTDVSILRKMSGVQIVSLSVNNISTLQDFAHCHNLEELYIRKNDIRNLAEVCYLKKLPNLRVLWLADNPCAIGDRYRMTVLKHLPNLQKLDNMLVQESEVNDAIELGMELSLQSYSPGGDTSPQASEQSHDHQVKLTAEGAAAAAVAVAAVPIVEDRSLDLEEGEIVLPNPAAISWEETNKIRAQLGLKALPVEKVTPMRPRTSHSAKARNANLLQAVLHLIRELDAESLEVVSDAVRNRLESL